jgi:large subunit ribosomal protein L6
MSRIGKQPVALPSGVKLDISGQKITATGKKGTNSITVPDGITVKVDGANVVVTRADDSQRSKAMHGLTRALLANLVKGVAEGYELGMEVYGTGYTSKVQGRNLMLNVGFMGRGHGKPAQFIIPIPDGLEVKVQTEQSRGESEPAKFTISGIDKQKVGDFAAAVRKIRKPEPYKGKGIRYAGEHVRRKVGKQFAGGGG